jgi:hypothetical protein
MVAMRGRRQAGPDAIDRNVPRPYPIRTGSNRWG